MTPEQIDGITKARLICNLSRAADEQFADNDAYTAWVCRMAGIASLPDSALDSYVEQHADKEIPTLEAEVAEKLDDTPESASAKVVA